ncbi:MAG: ABC transporter permease [Gemmatimonadetes bacterium]|nr:ABC transporter permease [Gemmatimonadota bacterium]
MSISRSSLGSLWATRWWPAPTPRSASSRPAIPCAPSSRRKADGRRMHILEGVTLAMQQLKAEKLKSFFALLGVIIGVMFLLVVVSVVEGMDRYMREDFAGQIIGINTVTLSRNSRVNFNPDPEFLRAQRRRRRITFADAEVIRARLSVPARIGVESDTNGQVVADNGRTVTNVRVLGASAEIFQIRNWEMEKGRAFTPLEADRGVPVVVLGWGTADLLFENVDPAGRTVRISGFPYRVVGVMASLGSLFGESLDNQAVAPARSPIQAVINPHGVVDQIVIQSLDPAALRQAQAEVEGIMRVRRGLRPRDDNDFALETADETLSFWDRISRILFIALPGLVAIALVVGGIVIMNIMLVSVMQRTREIGVRKAIGARRSDILTQVLIESATLSGVGAVIGVILGVALALLVRTVTPLPAAVAPKWILLGVALGVTVGVVAGVYPASRASRLPPVDALRHE